MADKIKTYDYPPENENRLIIKINESGIGFRKEFEDSSLLRIIGEDDMITTVDQVNNLCNKVYLKSRMEETKDFNSGLSKV